MSDLILYGMNEAGETVLRRQLAAGERDGMRALASAQLSTHHAVEIWDGPLCVVRLRREREPQG